jgi:hypothetical protein
MTYPDGIDALVNVNANDTLAAGGHAARHNSVNTALVEVKDYLVGALGSKLDIAGGKILQIVRATDSTNRFTTSTSFVDASLSVTITPQKSDSAILLLWSCGIGHDASAEYGERQITDNSNNAISGAERSTSGSSAAANFRAYHTLVGYSTPATENATTYKARFRSNTGNQIFLTNAAATAQLYAIEVSA